MAAIQAALNTRLATPSGIASGEVPVWNGTTWARSSITKFSPSGLSGYPSDVTKTLRGDGSWQGSEIGYDQITAPVNITGLAIGSATTVIPGSAHTFDGNPVVAEFFAPWVKTPSAAVGNALVLVLYEGGSAFGQSDYITPAAASMFSPGHLRLRFTPSAGSHTFFIGAWVSNTTGTPQVGAGAGGGADLPAYLRFTRAS